MGLSNKLNSGRSTVAAGIDTEALQYVKAADIVGVYKDEPIILKGFLRYKTKKGPAVLVVTDDNRGIYLPQRYCETFDELTDEEVQDIIEGHNAIVEIEPMSTPNGDTVRITFADI